MENHLVLSFFAVRDTWPKLIPLERSGKFAVVAGLAISGAERSEFKSRRLAFEALGDVLATGTVTGFATDIRE